MNPAGLQFDEERLYALLRRYHGDGPQVLLDRVINEVRSFAGEREQSDDITLLICRRC